MSNINILDINPIMVPADNLRISPIEEAFEDPSISCLHHSLGFLDERHNEPSPLPIYGAWQVDERGEHILRWGADLPPKAIPDIARMAGSVRDIIPFRNSDPDTCSLFSVHYYRRCTIISWATLGAGFGIQANFDKYKDHPAYDPEKILAQVYVPGPQSNHQSICEKAGLITDLNLHASIISSQSALKIAIGNISAAV